MISAAQMRRGLGASALNFAVLFVLSGCGTVEHKLSLVDNFVPDTTTGIEVGKVTNETGKTFGPEINVEDMLRAGVHREINGRLFTLE